MYTTINFKTKKELKQAIKDGQKITYYQPGPFGGSEPTDGTITLEGPHYPAAHSWYAIAEAVNSVIVSVK